MRATCYHIRDNRGNKVLGGTISAASPIDVNTAPVDWCTPVVAAPEARVAPADWSALQAAGRWVGAKPAASGEPAMAADHTAIISWLQDCLREAGMCIDGGKCHHGCRPDPGANCFRKDCCVPLSGSGLSDDWRVPAPAASGEPADHVPVGPEAEAANGIAPDAQKASP